MLLVLLMVEVADLLLVSTFTMFLMVECSTTVQLLLLVLMIMTVADLLLVSTFRVFWIGDSFA